MQQTDQNHGMSYEERLRLVVSESGMSQAEVSRLAGLDPSELSRIMKGSKKKEPIAALEQVANALGVSLHWLRTGEGERHERGAVKPVAPKAIVAPVHPAPAAPARVVSRHPAKTIVVYEDAYPSRGVVLALLDGKIDPNILAALASIRLESDRDPGEAFWRGEVKRLRRDLDEIERDGATEHVEESPKPGDRMPPD